MVRSNSLQQQGDLNCGFQSRNIVHPKLVLGKPTAIINPEDGGTDCSDTPVITNQTTRHHKE